MNASKTNRVTVDLTPYPDLVVIYLGMRVNAIAGVKTLLGFGPKIAKSVEAKPDGLLLHEPIFYSLRHVGMRQYWRDFESLERWSRSEPHKIWWQQFLKDAGGTGFWHETYLKRGGMEAVYLNMEVPTGFARFAPALAARGSMFSARRRAGMAGETNTAPPVGEDELYRAAG
ncbi:MAG: DUF4188 domain-containing protein [Acidobacteriota bacterium]